VTENEVIHGLLASKSDHKPLVFLREVEGYDPKAENAQKYANLITKDDGSKELDQESWDLVVDLKNRIRKVVPKERLFEYKAKWTGTGISTDHLATEGEDLEKALCALIDTEISRYHDEEEYEKELKLQRETAEDMVKDFVGREPQLAVLDRAFYDAKTAQPYKEGFAAGRLFLVTGLEGNGKKTLAANRFLHWKDKGVKVVYRMVNGTADSRYYGGVLFSVLCELTKHFKGDEEFARLLKRHEEHEFVNTSDFSWAQTRLEDATRDLISAIPADKPVTFIFSNILVSEYSEADAAGHFDLRWLPRPTPPHIGCILTMGSIPRWVKEWASMDNLKHDLIRQEANKMREADKENKVEVKDIDEYEKVAEPKLIKEQQFPLYEIVDVHLEPLARDDMISLLTKLLKSVDRTLVRDQYEYVLKKLEGCPMPLLIELVSNHVAGWRSSDKSTLQEQLPVSIVDGVHLFLARVEKYHGRVLVSRTLATIFSSLAGITEEELRSSLSSDVELLKDISQYHQAKELPAIVWSRLFLDILPMLRDQGGLLFLAFEALAQAVYDRYLRDQPLVSLRIHTLLARRYALLGHASSTVLNWEAKEPADEKTLALAITAQGEVAKSWSDNDDYRVPLRLLRAMVYHMRKAKQIQRCDHAFTDLMFLRTFLLGPRGKISDYVQLARDCIVDAMLMGQKMDRMETFLKFMTTRFQETIDQYLWPWEVLPENVPESLLQLARMNRQRGSDVIWYTPQSGWHFFDRHFSTMYFPKFMPQLWQRTPMANQMPIMRVQFGPKKPLPPNLQREMFPYGCQRDECPVPPELEFLRKGSVMIGVLRAARERAQNVKLGKLQLEEEETQYKVQQAQKVNEGSAVSKDAK